MTDGATIAPQKGSFRAAAHRLAAALAVLADPERRDRGKLASLRRGLGQDDGWHPAVAMVVDPEIANLEVRDERLLGFYQAAALFGLHPEPRRREVTAPRLIDRSFTRAMHELALRRASERGGALEDVKKPLDRRVIALLDADRADIFHHLRHAVGLLRGTDIGIDWAQLMLDLDDWDRPDRSVQRRWSRAWWPAPTWTAATSTSVESSEGAPGAG